MGEKLESREMDAERNNQWVGQPVSQPVVKRRERGEGRKRPMRNSEKLRGADKVLAKEDLSHMPLPKAALREKKEVKRRSGKKLNLFMYDFQKRGRRRRGIGSLRMQKH